MTVGKNKRLTKGKKGLKKKLIDPYTRKEWYDIKAPIMFNERNVGKTIVTKTTGTKIAADGLRKRIVEVSLADLQKDEDQSFRKIKLVVDEVQGKDCLTNFHGMDFTSDKIRSLVKKWQSLIEAHVDVRTTDGYILRLFCIAFTRRLGNQIKKTCYAQTAQIKQIRREMMRIMTREVSSLDLKGVVMLLIPDAIGKSIHKACSSVFPLQNVFIRKVKVIKSPKFDIGKLLDLHNDANAVAGTSTGGDVTTGKKVDRSGNKSFAEPAFLQSV